VKPEAAPLGRNLDYSSLDGVVVLKDLSSKYECYLTLILLIFNDFIQKKLNKYVLFFEVRRNMMPT